MSAPHRRTTSAHLIALALSRHRQRSCFVQGGHTLRYAEVERMVFAMAQAFQAMGLRLGEGVGCLGPNRPEGWAVAAATQMAGCRYTPLNPRAAADDLAFIATDAELSLIVYDATCEALARDVSGSAGCRAIALGPGRHDDLLALADGQSGDPFRPVVEESDVAVVAYTGGTTGRPKGVVLPHRCTVANVTMTLTDWQLPSDLRVLLCTPLSHSAGTMVLPTLLRGGTIHLLDGFDAKTFLKTIETERITCTLGVPTLIYALLDEPALDRTDLGSLQAFIYGSSPISPTRLEEAMVRMGGVFMQLYGQTEAPNTVTFLRKEDHDLGRPHLLASCGQAMAGVEVSLVVQDGEDVEEGAEGEICVRGPIVMDGYWKRPQETASTLAGGWLHTGDVARRDAEGYFYIVDRLKDVVISGGFNVYPREVEDALATHPAVSAAAVIGVPDAKWGEALKAFVVLRSGACIGIEELQRHVRDRKGPVHAPKSVELVESLPQTPVGKPDKAALRERYWADTGRRVH